MKQFARVNDLYGNTLLLNLRYVVKIRPGNKKKKPSEVTFDNGEVLQLTASEGARLILQLNDCCDRRGKRRLRKGRRLTVKRALRLFR